MLSRPTDDNRAKRRQSDARAIDRLSRVADSNRVLGIVTVSDLLELTGRGSERPVASATRRTLNHRVPHRKQSRAMGVW